MYMYPIDYSLFNEKEIVIIVEFLALIEDANTGNVKKEYLLRKYQEYRKVINSISIEKQIDKDFEKVSGFSIYKTIKKYEI